MEDESMGGDSNHLELSSKLRQKNFTLETLQGLKELCGNPKDCLRYFAEVLGLENYRTEARHAFVLDYLQGINTFVVETKMELEQSLSVLSLGKDLLCNLLDVKGFQESEDFFRKRVVALNASTSDDKDSKALFSPIDLREVIDFFMFTFFQHHALYKYCFSEDFCKETHDETVYIETALMPPLIEALSKEELDAQELVAKQAKEAEEKARQETLAKDEAERVAAQEALLIEERKKKAQTLDEAVDRIVREKLEKFKESFLEGCVLEQKRLIEKLGQLEASAGGNDGKTRKP